MGVRNYPLQLVEFLRNVVVEAVGRRDVYSMELGEDLEKTFQPQLWIQKTRDFQEVGI